MFSSNLPVVARPGEILQASVGVWTKSLSRAPGARPVSPYIATLRLHNSRAGLPQLSFRSLLPCP